MSKEVKKKLHLFVTKLSASLILSPIAEGMPERGKSRDIPVKDRGLIAECKQKVVGGMQKAEQGRGCWQIGDCRQLTEPEEVGWLAGRGREGYLLRQWWEG